MPTDDQRRERSRRVAPLEGTALAVVLAVALVLRLWNLSFGLPDWYHPDEPLKAREVSRMAGGDLHPSYLYHPTFMHYASAAVLRLQYAVGGVPLGEQEAVRVGRVVVAAMGTGTVLLTYVLGRVVGGGFVAVVAAALLAVAPLHVVCSHYLKEDVPMTFWAVATVLASLRIVSRGRTRDYFLAGLLAGLTAGTKYIGILFVGVPWLAHRERPAVPEAAEAAPRRTIPPLVRVALAGAVAGFLLTTPYALLDWWRFGEGVGHTGGNVLTGMADIAIMPLPYLWTFHFWRSIVPGLGLVPTLLALGGFVIALRRREPAARLLTTVVFVLYTVVESSPYKPPPNAERYVVPLLPFLSILCAQMLLVLEERMTVRWPRAAHAALGLVLAATIGFPLADTVALDRAMAADTREAARDWLVAHACGNGRILLEGALSVHDDTVPSYVARLPDTCAATYTYSLVRNRAELENYDFLVATSFMYDRFLELAAAPPDMRHFYEEFFASHQPVAEFTPAYRSYGFHNPTIRIYANSRQSAVGSRQ